MPTVEATSTYDSAGQSLTHTVPVSGGAPGELAVILFAADAARTITGEAGWTTPAGLNVLNGSAGGGLSVGTAVSYKILGASEPDPVFDIDVSDDAAAGVWFISDFDGAAILDASDVDNTFGTGTNTGTTPDITTTVNNALILYGCCLGAGRTITPPSLPVVDDFNFAAGSTLTVAGGHRTLATAGATGTEDYTWLAQSGSRANTYTLAITPAAAPGVGGLRKPFGGPLLGPFGGPING